MRGQRKTAGRPAQRLIDSDLLTSTIATVSNSKKRSSSNSNGNSNGNSKKGKSRGKKGKDKVSTLTAEEQQAVDAYWNSTACYVCGGQDNDHLIILCDNKDEKLLYGEHTRKFCHNEAHLYCLRPPLLHIPNTWFCSSCDEVGSTQYLESYFQSMRELRELIAPRDRHSYVNYLFFLQQRALPFENYLPYIAKRGNSTSRKRHNSNSGNSSSSSSSTCRGTASGGTASGGTASGSGTITKPSTGTVSTVASSSGLIENNSHSDAVGNSSDAPGRDCSTVVLVSEPIAVLSSDITGMDSAVDSSATLNSNSGGESSQSNDAMAIEVQITEYTQLVPLASVEANDEGPVAEEAAHVILSLDDKSRATSPSVRYDRDRSDATHGLDSSNANGKEGNAANRVDFSNNIREAIEQQELSQTNRDPVFDIFDESIKRSLEELPAINFVASAEQVFGSNKDIRSNRFYLSDYDISSIEMVGCSVELFCPQENLFHTGRIVDRRYDSKLDTYEHLVVFKSGSNDRNRGYTTWLVLDEHCCIVLIPPLWIRLGTPYLMPAQVAYCSGLELQRRVELLGSPAEESKAKSSSSTMNKVDLTSDEYDGGNIISDMQMSNSLITVSNDSAASYGYEGLSVDNNRSRQTHKEDNISTECNITIDGLSDFASEADRRFGRVEDCAVNNKNRFDSTVSEIDSIGSCCGTFSCCLKCNSIMDTNNVSTTSNCSSYRYCICCRNIDRKSVISFIDSTRDSNEEKAPSVDDIDREDQLAPNSNSSGTAASSSDNEDCVLIVPELSDSISILINRMTLCKFLLPTEKYSWLPTGLLDYAINSADISSGIIKIGAVGVSRSALAKRGTQLLEAGSTWLQNPENYAVRSFKYSQERRSLPKELCGPYVVATTEIEEVLSTRRAFFHYNNQANKVGKEQKFLENGVTTKQTEQILKQDPPKLDECTNKEKLQVLSKYHALLHDVHKAMFNETRSELSASVALTLADDTSPAPAAIPYDSEAWKRVFLLENTIVRGVDTINSDDKGRLFSVSSDLLDNKLSDVSDEALIVSVESSEAAPGVDITLHDVLSSGPRNPLISDNSAAKRVYDTLVVESILFEMMFRIESVEITAAPRTDSESSNTSGSAEVIVRSIDEEYDSTRHIILDGMNMKYEVLPPSANNNYGNLHTSIIYDCQVADFLNGTTHFAANNSCSNRSNSEKPQMKTVLKEGDFLSGFVFDSFEKSMQLEEELAERMRVQAREKREQEKKERELKKIEARIKRQERAILLRRQADNQSSSDEEESEEYMQARDAESKRKLKRIWSNLDHNDEIDYLSDASGWHTDTVRTRSRRRLEETLQENFKRSAKKLVFLTDFDKSEYKGKIVMTIAARIGRVLEYSAGKVSVRDVEGLIFSIRPYELEVISSDSDLYSDFIKGESFYVSNSNGTGSSTTVTEDAGNGVEALASWESNGVEYWTELASEYESDHDDISIAYNQFVEDDIDDEYFQSVTENTRYNTQLASSYQKDLQELRRKKLAILNKQKKDIPILEITPNTGSFQKHTSKSRSTAITDVRKNGLARDLKGPYGTKSKPISFTHSPNYWNSSSSKFNTKNSRNTARKPLEVVNDGDRQVPTIQTSYKTSVERLEKQRDQHEQNKLEHQQQQQQVAQADLEVERIVYVVTDDGERIAVVDRREYDAEVVSCNQLPASSADKNDEIVSKALPRAVQSNDEKRDQVENVSTLHTQLGKTADGEKNETELRNVLAAIIPKPPKKSAPEPPFPPRYNIRREEADSITSQKIASVLNTSTGIIKTKVDVVPTTLPDKEKLKQGFNGNTVSISVVESSQPKDNKPINMDVERFLEEQFASKQIAPSNQLQVPAQDKKHRLNEIERVMLSVVDEQVNNKQARKCFSVSVQKDGNGIDHSTPNINYPINSKVTSLPAILPTPYMGSTAMQGMDRYHQERQSMQNISDGCMPSISTYVSKVTQDVINQGEDRTDMHAHSNFVASNSNGHANRKRRRSEKILMERATVVTDYSVNSAPVDNNIQYSNYYPLAVNTPTDSGQFVNNVAEMHTLPGASSNEYQSNNFNGYNDNNFISYNYQSQDWNQQQVMTDQSMNCNQMTDFLYYNDYNNRLAPAVQGTMMQGQVDENGASNYYVNAQQYFGQNGQSMVMPSSQEHLAQDFSNAQVAYHHQDAQVDVGYQQLQGDVNGASAFWNGPATSYPPNMPFVTYSSGDQAVLFNGYMGMQASAGMNEAAYPTNNSFEMHGAGNNALIEQEYTPQSIDYSYGSNAQAAYIPSTQSATINYYPVSQSFGNESSSRQEPFSVGNIHSSNQISKPPQPTVSRKVTIQNSSSRGPAHHRQKETVGKKSNSNDSTKKGKGNDNDHSIALSSSVKVTPEHIDGLLQHNLNILQSSSPRQSKLKGLPKKMIHSFVAGQKKEDNQNKHVNSNAESGNNSNNNKTINSDIETSRIDNKTSANNGREKPSTEIVASEKRKKKVEELEEGEVSD